MCLHSLEELLMRKDATRLSLQCRIIHKPLRCRNARGQARFCAKNR